MVQWLPLGLVIEDEFFMQTKRNQASSYIHAHILSQCAYTKYSTYLGITLQREDEEAS